MSAPILMKPNEAVLAHPSTPFVKGLACALAALAIVLPTPGHAQSGGRDCPAFPKVDFWGQLTHENVRRYVGKTHAGDWVAYLNQLQRQYETLANIQDRGKGAIIKRHGRKVRLSGENLARYITISSRRLSIVACLAEREETMGLNGFPTAAGTSEAVKAAAPTPPQKSPGGMDGTSITLPRNLMRKLRRAAFRQSVKDTRKTSVNDLVVGILRQELRNRNR